MTEYVPDKGHFLNLPLPLGEGGFSIAIADLCVRFEGLDTGLLEAGRSRYRPFLCADPPLHTVALYPGAPSYLNPAADRFLRLVEQPLEGGRLYMSTDFAGFWPAGSSRGTLRISSPEDGAASLRAMENYLRWVLADLALDHDGFILHAAGLVRGGCAYVLFGPSGAGKSTAAALSTECALLSDDLVLLVHRDGQWRVATTPFRGSLEQGTKTPGLFPLARACRLVQGSEHSLESLEAAEGAASLLASCPFVFDPALRHERLVPLVTDCSRQVPVGRLTFANDPGFWSVFEETRR